MTNKIYFIKVREVRSPERAFPTSAGIDFFMPLINQALITRMSEINSLQEGITYCLDNEAFLLLPTGSKILIPSGIKMKFEDNSALIAANKSGRATKDGLMFTAEVVDSEYTGEIHIGLYNSGKREVKLVSGDKLIQFVHTPILTSELELITEDSYEDMVKSSLRGEAGFGSTDNK